MIASSRSSPRRRCWLCEHKRTIIDGQMTPTRVPHWVCRRCWRRKYFQIANSAIALLPPGTRFELLQERARNPDEEPFAQA